MIVERGFFLWGRQVVKLDQMAIEPFLIRLPGGNILLEFFITDNPARFGIDQKHASRLQTAFFQHPFGLDIEHPHFGAHDHQIVLGHVITRRAQAVAVEHGAHANPIGKRNRGRTVPGLHQTAVILVKGPFGRIHAVVVFPRLRDHHHHGVGERTAPETEEFETVVEFGRVTAIFLNDRKQFGEIIAKELRGEFRLARMHPVFVAPQSIDLAIVNEIPVGMRAFPARKRVGAKTGVDDGQRRRHSGIQQIWIKHRHLKRGQHAFVNNGLV